MKTESLQHLIEKYREGTLSDSELSELQRLSHRDEVMAAAGEKAHSIIRRRRQAGISFAAAALVVGAALWTLLPQHREEAPLIAETTELPATEPATVEVVATPQHEAVAMAQPVPHKAPAAKHTATTATPAANDEPVVMCNNQCEADSVINDIWKFLTV